MPPTKNDNIISIRSFILVISLPLLCCCFWKKRCEISIPKSVNKPVRWVVRTTAFDILVTYEFCKPIAYRSIHINMSRLIFSIKLPNTTTDISNILSINVGYTYTLSRLFSLYFSIKKPDVNEPAKNESIYNKNTTPIYKWKFDTSYISSAKCPVTLVVNWCKAKKPVTLTNPATNDSTIAICLLCLCVRALP